MNNQNQQGIIRRELTSFTIECGINYSGVASVVEKALISHNYDLDITPIKDEHTGCVVKEEIKVFMKEPVLNPDDEPKCY